MIDLVCHVPQYPSPAPTSPFKRVKLLLLLFGFLRFLGIILFCCICCALEFLVPALLMLAFDCNKGLIDLR